MDLCVPKAMILGHSFVRRMQNDMTSDTRMKKNFGLSDVKIRMFGTGGRTVKKLRLFDLDKVKVYGPDIVILEIGTNDLSNISALTVGDSIDELAKDLITKYSVQIVCICLIIPRKNEKEFNEKLQLVNNFLQTVTSDNPKIFVWKHHGLIAPKRNVLLRDGVHVNAYGQYLLYRSYRGAIMKATKVLKMLNM